MPGGIVRGQGGLTGNARPGADGGEGLCLGTVAAVHLPLG